MQLNIIDKEEQPLLSRIMLKAALEFEKATPSYEEVASLISSHIKADEKLIAIRHIYNLFGHKKAEVIAYIYTDENKKQLIEPKLKKTKGGGKEAEAQPKAEKAVKPRQEKADEQK